LFSFSKIYLLILFLFHRFVAVLDSSCKGMSLILLMLIVGSMSLIGIRVSY